MPDGKVRGISRLPRLGWLRGSTDDRRTPPGFFDDFDAGLVGWSTLGSLTTLNAGGDVESHLHMSIDAPGTFSVYGIYRPSPATPFTVTAKIGDWRCTGNYMGPGLLLAEASPGKLMCFGPMYHSTYPCEVGYGLWNSRTSRASFTDISRASQVATDMRYIRYVVTSTTSVATFYSRDGLSWNPVSSAVNPSMTIGSFGLHVTGQDNNVPLDAYFDWIRVT